ncbi:MAG TPA: Stp1/IreP family PP2C-type Ser/Thr phosphatase [Candidatus Limiplasma sp.]|nr:Stp1/IreP family PP2C-type Ser/Thr phosphatase [Candidatus Limiplasma sp.]
MLIYAKTHKGLVRPTNQDSLLVSHNLYGVADGMGGHRGGETASRIAVQVVRNLLQGKTPEENTLRIGVDASNRRIFDMQRHELALSGMGTTLTLLWEGRAAMWIAHVGDSRAYLFRDGELICRTEDHSVVGELLRNHMITPDMAKTHPYRSVITRALGTDPTVSPDVLRIEKKLGDVWLICSDGLYNMVEDIDIAEILASLEGEQAADKLLEVALDHGGHDNVSLVLGRVTEVIAP